MHHFVKFMDTKTDKTINLFFPFFLLYPGSKIRDLGSRMKNNQDSGSVTQLRSTLSYTVSIIYSFILLFQKNNGPI
jgi:hypothetical protein